MIKKQSKYVPFIKEDHTSNRDIKFSRKLLIYKIENYIVLNNFKRNVPKKQRITSI